MELSYNPQILIFFYKPKKTYGKTSIFCLFPDYIEMFFKYAFLIVYYKTFHNIDLYFRNDVCNKNIYGITLQWRKIFLQQITDNISWSMTLCILWETLIHMCYTNVLKVGIHGLHYLSWNLFSQWKRKISV